MLVVLAVLAVLVVLAILALLEVLVVVLDACSSSAVMFPDEALATSSSNENVSLLGCAIASGKLLGISDLGSFRSPESEGVDSVTNTILASQFGSAVEIRSGV